MLADALTPYKLLVQRLQTTHKPISHMVRLWSCEMFESLNCMFLSDAPEFGPCFKKWLTSTEVQDDLVDQIKAMTISFVFAFLHEV